MRKIKPSINKKPYYILFIIILIVSMVIFVFASGESIRYSRVHRELTEKFVVRSGTHFLNDALTTSITDVLLLTSNVENIVEMKSTEEFKIKKIEELFREFGKIKEQYIRINVIDINGNELIDVNNKYTPTILKPDDKDYSYEHYFQEAIKLNDDEVYIANFDVHYEAVNQYDIVIKFCAPIYVRNELQGIIVLTYDMNNLFVTLDELANEFDTTYKMFTSDGKVIDSSKDFVSFDANSRFSKEYSEEWKVFSRSSTGEIEQSITKNGLFTFIKFDLFETLDKSLIDVSKVKYEANIVYLSVFTLKNSNYDEILYTSRIDEVYRLIVNDIMYVMIIIVASIILTVLAYFRSVAIKKMKIRSEYDALTSILNRRGGMSLAKTVLNSDTLNHLPVSICFVDVNGLKEVNDTLGHKFGDELISSVASVVNNLIRSNDIFMRVGGDEFIFLLMNCTEEQAKGVWQKILASFEYINSNDDRPYNISASCGILEYKDNNANGLEDAIEKADKLMYENKKSSKVNFKAVK